VEFIKLLVIEIGNIMTKTEAMKGADDYFMETGQHAHVVTYGGSYEWFCHSYFDNGFSGGRIVYSTWNSR